MADTRFTMSTEPFFSSGKKLKQKRFQAVEEYKEKVSETQRKQRFGEIYGFEAGLQNTGDLIRLFGDVVGLDEVVGPAVETVARGVSSIPGASAVTEPLRIAAQQGQKIVEQNPRTASALSNAALIASTPFLAGAQRSATNLVNRVPETMGTMIPENYAGSRIAEAYGSTKAGLQALPKAVRDSLSPEARAYQRELGISKTKGQEVGAAVSKGNESFGAYQTAKYLELQNNPNASLALKTPMDVANFHKFTKANNVEDLKNQIFVQNRSTLGGGVPSQVQERALNHMYKSTGIDKKKETSVVAIKRNEGYDGIGTEGRIIAQGPNPIMRALASNENAKGSLDNWVKTNKVPRGQKANKEAINQARKKLTASDMEEYFKHYNKVSGAKVPVNFRKGEGDDPFYYFQSSHNSRSKELGGVNLFVAMNPNSGQVFTLLTDRHDLMKIDPVGGRPLITVTPMQVNNFKADPGKRFVLDKEGNEQRKKERLKQQQQSASALEQRTGIEKARNESPVSYQMRVFREYQPPVTAADREAAIKAGGMLTGLSTNVAAAQDDS
tara:strand:+ start:4970 stop:6631 length:1662 start_codon:yes stop_codon:yes gene_type:complete